MNEYDRNDIVTLSTTCRVAGVLTDPTTVRLFVLSPAGAEYEVTTVNDSVGQYHGDVDHSDNGVGGTAGVWHYRWEGTGAAQFAEEGEYRIKDSLFPGVPGAADPLDHINETVAAHAASAVSVTPSGLLVATDVQAALEDLAIPTWEVQAYLKGTATTTNRPIHKTSLATDKELVFRDAAHAGAGSFDRAGLVPVDQTQYLTIPASFVGKLMRISGVLHISTAPTGADATTRYSLNCYPQDTVNNTEIMVMASSLAYTVEFFFQFVYLVSEFDVTDFTPGNEWGTRLGAYFGASGTSDTGVQKAYDLLIETCALA